MQERGVYLHFPFCRSKCFYCDFVSRPGRAGDILRYVSALEREIERGADGSRIDTVFFGGGTPSLMEGEAVERLLQALRKGFALQADAEITLEGNPGTFTKETLRAYRQAGINRLSLGAQAKQAELLRAVGRKHSWEDVLYTVRQARDAGFANCNVDLMYGLPEQTPAQWRETLEAACAISIEHISAYSLIVEDSTPLQRWVEAGKMRLPEEDAVLEMETYTRERLQAAGFARYEISNYAQPGRECRHNGVYWANGEYYGFGCAAHGRVGMERYAHTNDREEYMRSIENGDQGIAERTPLDEATDRFDTLMLGLRRIQGISLPAFRARFGAPPDTWWANTLRKLEGEGLLQQEGETLRLTERGLDLQNHVLVQLMA